MEKSLAEVEKLVGLSRRQIQEYEDYEKEGNKIAYKPSRRNKYGHLIYEDEHIMRLFQIRFYREMGYKDEKKKTKEDLAKLFNTPGYNMFDELTKQIKELEAKRAEIDRMIEVATMMCNTGMLPSAIYSFCKPLGNLNFDASISLMKGTLKAASEELCCEDEIFEEVLTEVFFEECFDILERIYELFSKGMIETNAEVQQQVQLLHSKVSQIISDSKGLFEFLISYFEPNGPIATELEFEPKFAVFIHEALRQYSASYSNSEFDELFESVIDSIVELGKKKYPANSAEVQKEVCKLHDYIKQFKLLASFGGLNFLNYISSVFKSDEYINLLDKGRPKGLSWFISRSFEIYCNDNASESHSHVSEEGYL